MWAARLAAVATVGAASVHGRQLDDTRTIEIRVKKSLMQVNHHRPAPVSTPVKTRRIVPAARAVP